MLMFYYSLLFYAAIDFGSCIFIYVESKDNKQKHKELKKELHNYYSEEFKNLFKNSKPLELDPNGRLQMDLGISNESPPYHARNSYFGDPIIVNFIKTNPNAVVPTKAHSNDAGFDLTANTVAYDQLNKTMNYGVGIKANIPPGHVGLLFPRSSIYKKDLRLANAVGVVDSGFLGEIIIKFDIITKESVAPRIYEINERIAQLIIIPIPSIKFEETDVFKNTGRGTGMFGSTGL